MNCSSLQLQPLLNRVSEIGEKYGKTNTQASKIFSLDIMYSTAPACTLIFTNLVLLQISQVVLNWLIAQDNVVPIPGAKNAEQSMEFAGALGWRLEAEEVEELRSLASDIKPVIGFPVEKL